MLRLSKWSLSSLLYLLTAAVLLPGTGLIAYSVYSQYRQEEQSAASAAYSLAQLTSDNIHAFLTDAREILTELASRPDMRRAGCDRIFTDFKSLLPQFSNLSRSRPDGFVDCSATLQPGSGRTYVGNATWFKQVYQQKSFVVGPAYRGPITGRLVSVLAHPIVDAGGQMTGALQAPIDLLKFRLVNAANKLPESTVISIFDREGTLIARSQEPEIYVGNNLRGTPIVEILLDQRQGTARSVSSQGIERIYGFVPIPGTSWLALAGISTEVALTGARQAAIRNSLVGSGVLLAVLVFALLLSRRITQPMREMHATARDVEAGELDARTPVGGPREMVAVANQFNSMLDAIAQSRERLLQAQSRLALLGTCVEHLNDMVVVMDATRLDAGWPTITSVNESFEKVTGYARDEVLGRTTRILHGPKTATETRHLLASAWAAGTPLRTEILDYTRHGTELWVEIDVVPVRDAEGQLTHWVSIERDISERKIKDAEIEKLAYFDGLTGLPNRRLVMSRLDQTLSAIKRHAGFGAVFFVDLDRFKSVNDAWGHTTGDTLLRQVADRLSRLMRKEDTVARLGGDEFVILVPDLAPTQDDAARMAMTIAEKIRLTMEQSVVIDGQTLSSDASVGVTLISQEDLNSEDLLREADIAMYRAKTSGRNQIAFFETAMQSDVRERVAFEHDLSRAIELDQLSLYLQSQGDPDGKITGVEALLRWHHPVRGHVPPSAFIPVAEETGLILRLGDWTLREGCKLLVRLHQEGRLVPISVNVSPRQFRQADFVQRVQNILQETGAPAHELIFEVTEGLLVEQQDASIERMQQLTQLGIRFSIDDFGTGYSSLGYLKRLPLYELKIDRVFIKDLPGNLDDREIVQLVLSMAGHLRLRVVAEGVETPEQAAFLCRSGCGSMQGFLFCRPMPIEAWLAQQTSASP